MWSLSQRWTLQKSSKRNLPWVNGLNNIFSATMAMLTSYKCCTNSAIWTCFLPERAWVCKNHPSQFAWLDAAAHWLCPPLRISDGGGGGELNSHWFNKLITGRRNENVKWEVWDQIRTGEVNVALWGQRDRPVALCISDRGEQWDITHPENAAQKVRGAHECISVCPTVGLSRHTHTPDFKWQPLWRCA